MWIVTSSNIFSTFFEAFSVTEIGLWVSLTSGLPYRYRLPFLLVLGGGSAMGLTVLAYKLRTADTTPGHDSKVNSKLERTDLLEGGDPENPLEWVITASDNRNLHLVIIGSTLGLGVLLGALGYFTGLAGALVFAAVLFGLHGFLRFGWPHLEAIYDRRQPVDREADSLQFQGFSTDTLVFLTLCAIGFVGMFLLVALEMLLS